MLLPTHQMPHRPRPPAQAQGRRHGAHLGMNKPQPGGQRGLAPSPEGALPPFPGWPWEAKLAGPARALGSPLQGGAAVVRPCVQQAPSRGILKGRLREARRESTGSGRGPARTTSPVGIQQVPKPCTGPGHQGMRGGRRTDTKSRTTRSHGGARPGWGSHGNRVTLAPWAWHSPPAAPPWLSPAPVHGQENQGPGRAKLRPPPHCLAGPGLGSLLHSLSSSATGVCGGCVTQLGSGPC